MQYFVSLPDGWKADKKWPVVVVIEGADRQFAETAKEFAEAQKGLPFIVVTPLVVTNGGANVRSVPTYHYSEAVWDEIESKGPWTFDSGGLAAVVRDVSRLYNGEEKVYMTGFEAGGHTVWAQTLQRPESLRAVALVCPNYLGRYMDENQFSKSPTRTNLPVRGFYGGADELASVGHPIRGQWDVAEKAARDHGFENVTTESVAGKGHVHLAKEVLGYFSSILNK